MAQEIQYHSKHRERRIVRKYWTKARWKTNWANSKLCISMSLVKMLFRSPTPFSFVYYNILFLLGWFHSLLVDLLGRYHMALASSTSWGLQGNPGFNSQHAMNDLSRPPFGDNPETCLALASLVTQRDSITPSFYP